MNSLQLITKIKSRIDDLNSNYEQIVAEGHIINDIEKEILKKNCIELYELLLKLRTQEEVIAETVLKNKKTPKSEKEKFEMDVPEAKTFTQTIKQVKEDDITLDELALLVGPEKPVLPEDAKIESEKPEEKNEDFKEEIPSVSLNEEETILEEEDVQDEKEIKIPPGKIPVEEEESLNTKIAARRDITEKSSIEPHIDNLKTAISLNKKIAFVNLLFRENVVEYARAIDKINNAVDLNEALRYFTELKYHYAWPEKDQLARELEYMIKKRFGAV